MYLVHMTKDNERWDLISWRYYKSVEYVPDLIEANPHLGIKAVLPSGAKIAVPLIKAAKAWVDLLPPWKR